jgi:phage shock protein PspC (stress-responsive transcriptional regulator)
MKRNLDDNWLGGVIGGIAKATGIGSRLLRVVFLVLFFGIGGLSFGIGWGAVLVIYLLMWWILEGE